MQDCSISSALAMEILQSCTKSSIYTVIISQIWDKIYLLYILLTIPFHTYALHHYMHINSVVQTYLVREILLSFIDDPIGTEECYTPGPFIHSSVHTKFLKRTRRQFDLLIGPWEICMRFLKCNFPSCLTGCYLQIIPWLPSDECHKTLQRISQHWFR